VSIFENKMARLYVSSFGSPLRAAESAYRDSAAIGGWDCFREYGLSEAIESRHGFGC
jgi:hypothetical protein